jgi:diguanylate cyclase (GGDEF)-like protein/PAS domain S-box-containing protein
MPIFWKNTKFEIIASNKAFKKYIGMDVKEYLGKTDDEIPMWKSKAKTYRKADEKVLNEGKIIKVVEEIFINKNEKRIIETIKSPVIEGNEIIAITIILKDITEQKKAEEKLFKASYTDALTGLYNRAYFDKKIIELDDKRNYPLSVAMADVNGLKIMNDTFGHAVGDQVLQKIAEVLQATLLENTVIARLGGDEFAFIFPKTSLVSTEGQLEVASLEIHKNKIENVKLSISYGCATKLDAKKNLRDVFALADDIMYRRKRIGHKIYRKNIINTIMQNLFRLLPDETLHAKLVSKNCLAIAKHLKYSISDQMKMANFAGFHDIGKIAISKKILEKIEPLTEEDWTILKSHSEVGYMILSSSGDYREYADLVLTHHERYDGKGYPKGIKGKNIPEFSRILCVGDAIAAMESDRAYRKALTKEEILSELEANKGTQFDPKFAQVAIDLIKSGSLNVTDYSDEKFDLEDFGNIEF